LSTLIVKITPSRIKKGLLAIPNSMHSYFPIMAQQIRVFFDLSGKPILMPYTPAESSTNEARIYGLSHWYKKHNVIGEERAVITVINQREFIYRINLEDYFIKRETDLELNFIEARNSKIAESNLTKLSNWIGIHEKNAALLQYKNISVNQENLFRNKMMSASRLTREKIPPSLKTLIEVIYEGHCQLCDFTFLKRDSFPYFEIHHINPEIGHDPKNLLSICANCHRQFEFAETHLWRNRDGWLIRVKFNDSFFDVKQILIK